MSVRVGHVDRNRGGRAASCRPASSATRSTTATSNTKGTDVALLELSDRITNIAPLPLAPSTSTHLWDGVTAFANYDDGLAAGGGGIDTMGTLASKLQWVGNRILKPYTDADTGLRMIPVNTSICQGDSGSPLIVPGQRRRQQCGRADQRQLRRQRRSTREVAAGAQPQPSSPATWPRCRTRSSASATGIATATRTN